MLWKFLKPFKRGLSNSHFTLSLGYQLINYLDRRHKGLYIYYVITGRGGGEVLLSNMTNDDLFRGGPPPKI